MDFRRADPTYIGFVPKTASDAIDLFFRMKRLGLRPENYPEAFVWASRELDEAEGAKFEEWMVAPQGCSGKAEVLQTDPEAEKLRLKLLKEAEARDLADKMNRMKIEEVKEEDDEKTPLSSLEKEQKTKMVLEPLEFEDDETSADADVDMVSPSAR